MYHQPHNSLGHFNYNAYYYENTVYKMHFHRNYELIYAECGSAQVKTAHLDRTLCEGEWLLLPPNEPHSFTVEGESRVWVGVFSSDHISHFAAETSGKCYAPFCCDPSVFVLLKRFLLDTPQPTVDERIAAFGLVCVQCRTLAAELAEYNDTELVHRILAYMDANFTQNLTLSDMAHALGYEYHYFSSLFHRYFDVNFKEFLNTYRFERAYKLLTEENRSITEAAMESGFGSIRSFNRVYRDRMGSCPRMSVSQNARSTADDEKKEGNHPKALDIRSD